MSEVHPDTVYVMLYGGALIGVTSSREYADKVCESGFGIVVETRADWSKEWHTIPMDPSETHEDFLRKRGDLIGWDDPEEFRATLDAGARNFPVWKWLGKRKAA